MINKEIEIRYSELAKKTCCISCGGALDYAKPNPGEVCIDLGSGRGTDVFRLANIVGDDGFVYGIDATKEMIEVSNKAADKFEYKNVKFILSEIENIPLDDELADVIISNCVINHSMDKDKVFKEIYRLLKKGGRFSISDIYSIEPVPEEYRNDPKAVAECWAGAVTKEEYIKIIYENNFKDITILEESVPYQKGKINVASFTIFAKKY